MPLTDDIIKIIREIPAEETDNISKFLNDQITSLYPNNNKNIQEYLIENNFEYPKLITVPKIKETLKLFKYISSDEIREIPLRLNLKEEDKLIIYLYIAEYFLSPKRYVKIFKLKRKNLTNKNYRTL